MSDQNAGDGSAARIGAVVVNHNTSAWTELAVRSLFAHNPGCDITLVVYDNASTDDRRGMLAATAEFDVPVRQSGYGTDTAVNSHGQVLEQFTLDPANADYDYLLFLDADICFTRPGIITALLAALDDDATAFGAGPRMSWDGETEMPAELAANPGIYRSRLHPCCALVRNTTLFRTVTQQVGLACATLHRVDGDRYLDTFELATIAMRTHGLHHVIADALIMHAFAVSYPDESSGLLPTKSARRDAWLERLRA